MSVGIGLCRQEKALGETDISNSDFHGRYFLWRGSNTYAGSLTKFNGYPYTDAYGRPTGGRSAGP